MLELLGIRGERKLSRSTQIGKKRYLKRSFRNSKGVRKEEREREREETYFSSGILGPIRRSIKLGFRPGRHLQAAPDLDVAEDKSLARVSAFERQV